MILFEAETELKDLLSEKNKLEDEYVINKINLVNCVKGSIVGFYDELVNEMVKTNLANYDLKDWKTSNNAKALKLKLIEYKDILIEEVEKWFNDSIWDERAYSSVLELEYIPNSSGLDGLIKGIYNLISNQTTIIFSENEFTNKFDNNYFIKRFNVPTLSVIESSLTTNIKRLTSIKKKVDDCHKKVAELKALEEFNNL